LEHLPEVAMSDVGQVFNESASLCSPMGLGGKIRHHHFVFDESPRDEQEHSNNGDDSEYEFGYHGFCF